MRLPLSSLLLLFLFPGEDYLIQHHFDEASRYYHIMSSIAPSYDVYYGKAICALAHGNVNESVMLFQSIPTETPEKLFYLGIAHYRLGMYDQAIHYFENSNEVWQCNYYRALMSLKQYKISDAVKYFKLVPESNSKNLSLKYLTGYNQLVHAQEKFIERDYSAAVELYETVEGYFGYREIGLALTYAEMGEYDKSIALLDTVIQYSTDNQLITKSMLEAGNICYNMQKFSQARKYLKNYLAIESHDRVVFLLGKIFSDEAQYDSAAIYFRMLPDSVDEYLFYLGRTDYFLGLWGSAEQKLLVHHEIFPQSKYGDRTVYILASINAKRKEYHSAIDFWNELISSYPNSIYAATALEGIGDAYFNMGEYSKALQTFRKVKNYNPNPNVEMETTLKIYETLFYLGKYSSLVDALRNYIEHNRDSKLVPKTRLRIAKILHERGSLHQSLSELEIIIDNYYESMIANEATLEKARIYEQLGREEEAIQAYQNLLQRQDAHMYHAYVANELGSIYLKESKYDSALYYYNLLLDSEKYRESALFEIGKIYYTLGQDKGTEAMIDKLIAEYPASIFLLDAYILKSKVSRHQGNYQQALTVLNELIKLVGQKPEIYIEIGNIYFELEQYPDARDNYLNAAQHYKQERDDAAQALILAGDASLAIDDKKNAREYYLQANLIAKTLAMKHRAAEKMRKIFEE
jgi:tetratricopeptide (TPR) repeat protein